MSHAKRFALTFVLAMLLPFGHAFSRESTPSTPPPTDPSVCFSIAEGGDIALALERCQMRIAELNATREEIRQLRISRPSRVNLFAGCVAGISVIAARADIVCGGGIGWRLGK